jgi:hypothetical protein
MANTKQPVTKQPTFSDLKTILNQSKDTDSALYLTVKLIIDRLNQFQSVTLGDVNGKLSQDDASKKFATKSASFLTGNDDSTSLPNSLQLVAGTGITFDLSVANKLKIDSSGSGISSVYDSPLTDGNVDETNFIFANGDCIIVQIPE